MATNACHSLIGPKLLFLMNLNVAIFFKNVFQCSGFQIVERQDT